jgi:hypothetical protein
VVGALAASRPARGQTPGDDTTKACIQAYENAQEHRKGQQLLRAREELQHCAVSTCPAMVQVDCTNWLGQVLEAVPTVVFSARLGEENVFDVSVSMDGKPLVTQLDGRPLEVDPGLHTFVFERAGSPPIEKKTIVTQRDKAQVVSVTWQAVAPPPPPAPTPQPSVEKERPVPALFYVFGATTVAGFATFAVSGLMGEATKTHLEGSCSPNCTDSQVSPVRTRFIVADVGVGIGAASAAAALIVFLIRPERDKPAHVGVRSLGVAPVVGGASFELAGSF